MYASKQMEVWNGEFSKEYTKRNIRTIAERDKRYMELIGVSRTELNYEFVNFIDRSINILEVGSNVGDQLLLLEQMGFKNLTGIELQSTAVQIAKKRSESINFFQGSALDIPFNDNSFDLVFTSVVLIHISPQNITQCLKEIHRCSKKYIWGYEYYNNTYTEIEYRGNNDLLWKTNFCNLYLENFSDLRLVKEKKYKYIDNGNVDSMFLLEKV